MTDAIDEPDTQPEAPAKKGGLFWPIMVGILVVLCSALGAVKWVKGDPVDGYDAQVACKTFVERQLKAPSTAKFSGLSHSGSGPRWTVTGAVDAENSFGATVRSNWTCTVRISGDEFKLESLTGLS